MCNVEYCFNSDVQIVSFIDSPFNIMIVVGFRLMQSVLLVENGLNCRKFCACIM